jgi:Uma2 family endonuclease
MGTKTLITCDEFERMAPNLGPSELIDGEIIKLSPGGPLHSYVSNNIGTILWSFVEAQGIGWVLGNEAGIRIREDLPRSRGADVLYISFKRLPEGDLPEAFLKVPPELIVEVLKSNGSFDGIDDKIADYHSIGVDMVWVADPKSKMVKKFPRGAAAVTVSADGEIDGGEILPGFKVAVAQFFKKPRKK